MFYLGGESYRTHFLQRITYVKLFNAAFLCPFLLGYFEEEVVKKRNIGKVTR